MSWSATFCFLIGGMIGAWAGVVGHDSWWVAKQEKKKSDDSELLQELKELRAWKADNIHREDR